MTLIILSSFIHVTMVSDLVLFILPNTIDNFSSQNLLVQEVSSLEAQSLVVDAIFVQFYVRLVMFHVMVPLRHLLISLIFI